MSRENRGRYTGKTVSLTPQGAYRDVLEVSLEDKEEQDRKRLDMADWEVWTYFGLKWEAIKVLWKVRICFRTIDQVSEIKAGL